MKLTKNFEISVMPGCLTFQYDWRILAFNWEWGRWREFGYSSTWYDGMHNAFVIGPFNIYWNW